MNHTLCVTLLVVCHTVAPAQTPDLTPLWPPADSLTDPLRRAIEARQIAHAISSASNLRTPVRHVWQGIIAITQNDATTAIRALRKTNNAKALGVAYYLAGQHILFREQMEEAIRRNPADFGPYYYLGRHYDTDVDNPEEAARWLQLALQRKSDYAPARSHLGNCLERLGKLSEAETAYNASPAVALSQTGLARLRLNSGDTAAALIHVQRAIAIDSGDVRALKLAARIYGLLDRPLDAVQSLEAAAALAPRDATIHYQLARAYQSAGDSPKSAEAMTEYKRLSAIYGVHP